MEIIPYISVNRRKILEKFDPENLSSSRIWIIDLDARRGREMNFKLYNKLDFLDLYLDIAAVHPDDVFDALTMGAVGVTVSNNISREKARKIIESTENAIFTVTTLEEADKLRQLGATKFLSDSLIPPIYQEFYSFKLECENCFKLVSIEELNGRRNQETP